MTEIHAKNIEITPIEKIVPNPKNRNQHPEHPNISADSNGNIYRNGLVANTSLGGYKNQYKRVSIKNKKYYVHRLVLECFVGKCPKGMQACHNDGNSLNNSIENLRWDTPKNNSRDKIAHGTSGKGQSNAMARISDGEALSIICSYQLMPSSTLSDYYGISQGYISALATGGARFKKELISLYNINKVIAQKRVVEASKRANEKRRASARRNKAGIIYGS